MNPKTSAAFESIAARSAPAESPAPASTPETKETPQAPAHTTVVGVPVPAAPAVAPEAAPIPGPAAVAERTVIVGTEARALSPGESAPVLEGGNVIATSDDTAVLMTRDGMDMRVAVNDVEAHGRMGWKAVVAEPVDVVVVNPGDLG